MNSKEAYLQLVEQRKAEKVEKGEVLTLAMPSGADWLYLPFKIQQYALGGRLPMHLVARLQSVQNAPQKTLTEAEQFELGMAAMTVTRDIMLNNLVSPKITLEETPDSITPEQIDPEDFDFFLNFVVMGGQSQLDSKSEPAARKRKRAA